MFTKLPSVYFYRPIKSLLKPLWLLISCRSGAQWSDLDYFIWMIVTVWTQERLCQMPAAAVLRLEPWSRLLCGLQLKEEELSPTLTSQWTVTLERAAQILQLIIKGWHPSDSLMANGVSWHTVDQGWVIPCQASPAMLPSTQTQMWCMWCHSEKPKLEEQLFWILWAT